MPAPTALLLAQDEDRLKRAQNVVPSWPELNRQLARSEEEFQLFERLDAEVQVCRKVRGPCATALVIKCMHACPAHSAHPVLQWFDPTPTRGLPAWLLWRAKDLDQACSEQAQQRGKGARPAPAPAASAEDAGEGDESVEERIEGELIGAWDSCWRALAGAVGQLSPRTLADDNIVAP